MKKTVLNGGLIASACLVLITTAQAQYTPNNDDLLLGFTVPGSTGDLVIDLGKASSIVNNSFLDLTANGNVGESGPALVNQLTTLYGGINHLSWGVVAGHYNGAFNFAVYSTITQGSAAPQLGAGGQVVAAINTAGNGIIDFPTGLNQGVVDPTKQYGESWSEIISPGTLISSFNNRFYDPDLITPTSFTGSQVADFYQWNATGVQGHLQGSITLFANGDVQWNAVAVPEPTVWQSGCHGLVMFLVRRLIPRRTNRGS
jgi:hypothetical protein